MQITAILLAKNEESRINDAIRTVSFCDDILVVDDESTDKTSEIVNKAGARLMIHPKQNEFAGQRNWAMEQAKHDWILFIDADEIISEELHKEIVHVIKQKQSDITSYFIPRRDFFWNHEMKYGETKKARTTGILRLMKKGSGVWVGSVHEQFLPAGKTDKLTGYINHTSHTSLVDFVEDVNAYSTIRAEELHKQGKQTTVFELVFFPFGKFIYTYFILAGFLDGASGFVYSFVMSFHSFLVRAKLMVRTI